jgi:alkaline phosphatase D
MPIRVREPRIYRQFRFGGLADLIMLDTRLYARDQQAASGSDFATIADPDRTLLGDEQEAWLFDALQQSRARNATWRLIGQQVMMSQLVAGPTTIFNPDQWDGYLTARNRVYANLAEQGIGNVVVLTGDIHSSWANELTPNPFDPSTYNPATGAGALAVEFVTPGITSPGIPDAAQAAALGAQISATHPHVKYVDLFRRGYMLLDVTAAEMHAEWYHPDTILAPSQTEHFGAAFRVESGQAHLLAVASPLPAPAGPPAAP